MTALEAKALALQSQMQELVFTRASPPYQTTGFDYLAWKLDGVAPLDRPGVGALSLYRGVPRWRALMAADKGGRCG
jgi:hypothetical protein